MLIMTPPLLPIKALKAAEHILKVPKVSISKTVLNPFELILLADARKLPAAPFTSTSSLPNLATTSSQTA